MGYRLIQAVFPVSIPIYYDLGNIQYQIKRYKEMTVRDHIEFKLIVSTFLVPDFAIGGWNREGWVVFQLLLFQNGCEQYLSDGMENGIPSPQFLVPGLCLSLASKIQPGLLFPWLFPCRLYKGVLGVGLLGDFTNASHVPLVTCLVASWLFFLPFPACHFLSRHLKASPRAYSLGLGTIPYFAGVYPA